MPNAYNPLITSVKRPIQYQTLISEKPAYKRQALPKVSFISKEEKKTIDFCRMASLKIRAPSSLQKDEQVLSLQIVTLLLFSFALEVFHNLEFQKSLYWECP